ncbi:MAG: GcrA family cell cycle regulator [Alphaproteobacteria bacterium]|nr:GcrA family cell cycle regulator [Alphaproteobacteria bacterium]
MSDWTDGKINKLRELWARGFSTAEIGKKLDLTKNSIIGKINRLGLTSADKGVSAAKSAAVKKKAPAVKAKAVAKAKAPAKPAPKIVAKKSVKKSAAKPVAKVVKAPAKSAKKVAATAKSLKKAAAKVVPAKKVAPKAAPKAVEKAVPKKVEPAKAAKQKTKASTMDLFEVAEKSSVKSAATAAKVAPAKPAISAGPLFEVDDEKPVKFERVAADAPKYQLFDLMSDMCCWPLDGDAGDEECYFCGKKTYKGKPYCLEHSKLAYTNIAPEKEGDMTGSNGAERASNEEFDEE